VAVWVPDEEQEVIRDLVRAEKTSSTPSVGYDSGSIPSC
ncbi:uncharacterized protein METZ01_LOCUS228087, partial [marine metagenome]